MCISSHESRWSCIIWLYFQGLSVCKESKEVLVAIFTVFSSSASGMAESSSVPNSVVWLSLILASVQFVFKFASFFPPDRCVDVALRDVRRSGWWEFSNLIQETQCKQGGIDEKKRQGLVKTI